MKVQSGLYAFALIFGMGASGCSSGTGSSTGSGGAGSSGSSGGSGGSSASGESCSEVEACGGDVVGTWEVKSDSQCLKFDSEADIAYLGLTCVPNVAKIKGSLKVAGKLTLGSDKKFVDETVTTGSEEWQMDKSCLILSGTKVNCQSIGTTFEGALKSFGYESMVCKDASSGGGCTCEDKINSDAEDGRPGGMAILHNDAQKKGVYKTDGNKLSIGDSLSYSYCVKGSEMTLSPIPVEASGTPYKGTVVLTKVGPPPGGGSGGSSSAAGGSGGTSTASSSSKPPSSGGSSSNGGTSTRPAGGSAGGGTAGAGGTSAKAGTTTGGNSSVGGSSPVGGSSSVGGSSGGSSGGSGGGQGKEGPCDIYKAANTPCAAAFSVVRVLSKSYSGPLFQVRAGSNSKNNTMSGGTTKDIMPGADGFVPTSTVDEACGDTYCTVSVLYDQSGNENHIKRAPKGNTAGGASGALDDYESIATKGKVKAGGHDVYALYMNKVEGYRSTVVGKGMPTGTQPQGTYMLADGTRKGSACCWDFGNVTTKPATEWAFMDTICLGHTWWGNSSDANWFGFAIDFEGGVWAGGTKKGDPGWGALEGPYPFNSNNPSMDKAKFALGFIRVSQSEYAIRVADLSTATELKEAYKGGLPVNIGHKGGIVLGVGGDNSNNSFGTFYEGVMVAGYPTNDVEAKVMANIKAAGYSQ